MPKRLVWSLALVGMNIIGIKHLSFVLSNSWCSSYATLTRNIASHLFFHFTLKSLRSLIFLWNAGLKRKSRSFEENDRDVDELCESVFLSPIGEMKSL